MKMGKSDNWKILRELTNNSNQNFIYRKMFLFVIFLGILQTQTKFLVNK